LEKFVIMGLPRSGTTYLMTLLNAHKDVFCSGEQFNPHAIVGIKGDNRTELDEVLERDFAPIGHMERFFAENAGPENKRVGFKFMIGHNIKVLRYIAQETNLRLIYLHRDNKLAQISSLLKALETKKWAQVGPKPTDDVKIKAGVRKISQHWHEYETFDFLFESWFDYLPHRRIKLEYREMFLPDFNERICNFLGVETDPDMTSELTKQSDNTIIDRFTNKGDIRNYFTKLGLADWLTDELQNGG
jgi:LPS sulfotransferase NodH